MATIRKLFTVKRVLLVLAGLFVLMALNMMSFGIPEQDHRLYHVDLRGAGDGVHEAEFRIVPPFGTFVANKRFTVAVELRDHSITAVRVLAPEQMQDPFPELEARVVTEQSTALDGVSGATWSKLAYLKAAEAALVTAGGRIRSAAADR
jgi:hypothetical protein